MEALAITIVVCVFVIAAIVILIYQCRGGQNKKGAKHSVIVRRRPTVLAGHTYSDGSTVSQTTHGGTSMSMDGGGAAILAGAAAATAAFASTGGGDGGGFSGGGCGGGGS